MSGRSNRAPPTFAVVLPGGGTRGAYEAGALSVLLPALEARGEEVTICRARSRGELLSFLFFDPVFVEELMEMGQRDAQRWLSRHPNLWCSDRDHDFPVDHGGLESAREQSVVSEFRDHARMRLR